MKWEPEKWLRLSTFCSHRDQSVVASTQVKQLQGMQCPLQASVDPSLICTCANIIKIIKQNFTKVKREGREGKGKRNKRRGEEQAESSAPCDVSMHSPCI